jgi:hypothetical protein
LALTVAAQSLILGTTNITLTGIPFGKITHFVVPMTLRPPAKGAWTDDASINTVTAAIWDGPTKVGSELVASGLPTGLAPPISITLAISGYTFTTVPVLRLITTAVTALDQIKVQGMAW